MTEIPEESVEAAAKTLSPTMFREHTYVDPEPMRDMHRATARAALAAALPHLRVQETGEVVEHSAEEQWYCPSSNSVECRHAGFDVCCDAPEKHVALSFDLVEKAVVAYHATQHPRPVVDREALEDVLTRHWFVYIGAEEGFDCGCNEHGTLPGMPTVTECASHLAGTVLALLPTEEPLVYVVHHHDIEKTAEHFNQGYDEAQRQSIGGAESRNWLTEKVWPLLKDHIDPENSHHVADQIADALLSEADLSDFPTEEGEGS